MTEPKLTMEKKTRILNKGSIVKLETLLLAIKNPKIAKRLIEHKFLSKNLEDCRNLLFIACFPKSGSTYLSRLLMYITGFPRLMPVQFKGGNEQNFDLYELNSIRYLNGIIQQHLKVTNHNLRLLKEHKIKAAILTRNIFDIVLSLDNHFHNESKHFVTGYVQDEFFELSEDERYRYIIKLHLPWYFNFLLSWQEAEKEVPTLWITYEQLINDRLAIINKLFEYWSISIDSASIKQRLGEFNLNQVNTRLNKGISGRGKRLSETHKQYIYEIADSCKLNQEIRNKIGL